MRWDAATDVQVHRRAERIFKTMDWELQARFEHLEDDVVTGPDYLSHIVRILDTLSGENTLVDKRRAVRRALFEGQRKDGESISQFTLRREQEFAMAEKYMSFPGDLKALMMEEQAGLGKQGTLNLRTLTSGSTQYEDVVRALKVMDMDLDEEGLTSTGSGKSSFIAQTSAPEIDLEGTSVDFEDQSIKSEEVRDILAEIDELDLQEDEATEVLASMEREKRSWKENKKLKLARKKDRRHFSGKPSGSGERRQTGISVDQLKKNKVGFRNFPGFRNLDSETFSLDSETYSLDSETFSLDSETFSLDSETFSLDSETLSSETFFVGFRNSLRWTQKLFSLDSETFFVGFRNFFRWIQKLFSLDSETFFVGFRNFFRWIQKLFSLDSETFFVGFRNFFRRIQKLFSLDSETFFVGFRNFFRRIQKLFSSDSETFFVGFRNFFRWIQKLFSLDSETFFRGCTTPTHGRCHTRSGPRVGWGGVG